MEMKEFSITTSSRMSPDVKEPVALRVSAVMLLRCSAKLELVHIEYHHISEQAGSRIAVCVIRKYINATYDPITSGFACEGTLWDLYERPGETYRQPHPDAGKQHTLALQPADPICCRLIWVGQEQPDFLENAKKGRFLSQHTTFLRSISEKYLFVSCIQSGGARCICVACYKDATNCHKRCEDETGIKMPARLCARPGVEYHSNGHSSEPCLLRNQTPRSNTSVHVPARFSYGIQCGFRGSAQSRSGLAGAYGVRGVVCTTRGTNMRASEHASTALEARSGSAFRGTLCLDHWQRHDLFIRHEMSHDKAPGLNMQGIRKKRKDGFGPPEANPMRKMNLQYRGAAYSGQTWVSTLDRHKMFYRPCLVTVLMPDSRYLRQVSYTVIAAALPTTIQQRYEQDDGSKFEMYSCFSTVCEGG
ncbi:hypothetical protein DENSPDRAFT_854674 [Dentipellis sp. KUC8613]|nr:hypothetical protein DENSPDRAFT_854674 [Dentipellis sp. KUC8613]